MFHPVNLRIQISLRPPTVICHPMAVVSHPVMTPQHCLAKPQKRHQKHQGSVQLALSPVPRNDEV